MIIDDYRAAFRKVNKLSTEEEPSAQNPTVYRSKLTKTQNLAFNRVTLFCSASRTWNFHQPGRRVLFATGRPIISNISFSYQFVQVNFIQLAHCGCVRQATYSITAFYFSLLEYNLWQNIFLFVDSRNPPIFKIPQMFRLRHYVYIFSWTM